MQAQPNREWLDRIAWHLKIENTKANEWSVVKMEIANLESEIARLRADVERLREAIAPVVAEINNRWADVHDESWSADYHCEFEMTVAECRTLLLATAALAEPNEGGSFSK